MNNLPFKRLVIPLFIMNRGCPSRCAFCRRNGKDDPAETITAEVMEETVFRYLSGAKTDKKACVQIAFYGGNFTGLHHLEQDHLLRLAGVYVKNRLAHSLRISTRPDFIHGNDAERLRRFHVKTVEIGAQSMSDEVLHRSCRGHSSDDVERAIRILKEHDFETVVHLMVGLPGDSPKTFFSSVEKIVDLAPHMVRIHPTLVFPDTALATSFKRGEYRPLLLDEAVKLCRIALDQFERAGIHVIRVGLQPDLDLEQPGAVMAGPFHPAFRSLVEEERFLRMATRLLDVGRDETVDATFFISPSDDSYFRGINNGNVEKLKALMSLSALRIRQDPHRKKGSVKLAVGQAWYETDKLSGHIRTCRGG